MGKTIQKSNTLRVGRSRQLQRNIVFQTQQDKYARELTETVAAHTRPTQVTALMGGVDPGSCPNQEAVCN